MDGMDEIQLRVGLTRATAIADAIERDIGANPDHPDRGELSHTLYWLRHRIALRKSRTTQAEPQD